MASSPIRIVQFSDPHLLADEGGMMYGLNTLDSFKAVLNEIKKQNYKLALLTGDIAQDESRESYQHLQNCLKDFAAPVYLIPGNHDNMGLMSTMFNSDDISCRKQVVVGDWQIILLNSQLEGQVGGYLAAEEIEWLEKCLSSNAAPYALVCVHHQPVNIDCKWLDQIGLDNSDDLFEALAAYPQVKALLWGHIHQEFDEERAGLRLISCPSTCIQFKPRVDHFELDLLPPGYRWLELYEDGSLKTGINRLAEIPGEIDPSAKGY